MPRFVLLYHACPPSMQEPSHWDLMLERDGALMTWRLCELPREWQPAGDDVPSSPTLAAVRLPDHRLAYLDYKGPVSNNRGHVTRHDHGDYELLEEDAANIRLRLSGQQTTAEITLSKSPSLEGKG